MVGPNIIGLYMLINYMLVIFWAVLAQTCKIIGNELSKITK